MDWNKLNVGDCNLNNSENFFGAFTHTGHEKILQICDDDKENIANIKEEFIDVTNDNESELPRSEESETAIKTESSTSTSTVTSTSIKKESVMPLQSQNGPAPNRHLPNLLKQAIMQSIAGGDNAAKNQIRSNFCGNSANVHPPNAYKYSTFYDEKKKAALEKLRAIEKKERQFHSNPMPNFNNKPIVGQVRSKPITIPITPLVLKHKKTEQKPKVEVETYQPRKLVREAKVLQEEPFVPKRNQHHRTEVQPFNLISDKRLEVRKQYDEYISKKNEAKKKAEEREQKKYEQEMIKELRKLATFKARPNPFKTSSENS